MSNYRTEACYCEAFFGLKRNELDKECLMEPFYDPQAILRILRSPERTEPASVVMLLKSLILPPLHDLIKPLRQGIKRWFFVEAVHPIKNG